MITDVFQGDLFSTVSLTAAVNKLPYKPQELAQWLPWNAQGIATTVAVIEERDGSFDIVPAVPRGSAPTQAIGNPRAARPLVVPHYPLEATILASEIQGVRSFGSDSDLETIESKRSEKLERASFSQEVTAEFVRAGALSGLIRNKDGSTLIDLHETFGVARNTHDINFASATTDVIAELIDAKEKSEDELGAYLVDGFQLIAGRTLFKAVISHPSVKSAWERWQDGAALRADNRKGFEVVEGVFLRSYAKGKVGSVSFIDPAESFLAPVADGLYETRYAPADTIDFANTIGIPTYVVPEVMEYGRGIKLLVESNVVSWVNRPRAIVRIKQS